MSLKIFGGVAKGFSLVAPRNSKVRPTTTQLRRKLFDSIQNMEDEVFVDLCCGTGGMGIEALSRGVKKLILVDSEIKLAQENLSKLKSHFEIAVEVELIRSDVIKWLKSNLEFLHTEPATIFFDPPYDNHSLYEAFFELKPETFKGRVIIEACTQKTMSSSDFQQRFGPAKKELKQGTSYFLLY